MQLLCVFISKRISLLDVQYHKLVARMSSGSSVHRTKHPFSSHASLLLDAQRCRSVPIKRRAQSCTAKLCSLMRGDLHNGCSVLRTCCKPARIQNAREKLRHRSDGCPTLQSVKFNEGNVHQNQYIVLTEAQLCSLKSVNSNEGPNVTQVVQFHHCHKTVTSL